ncbi:10711_t:CDS:1 [Funneliformis geosporum]|uniref:13229_t:CDS:1 n=1 Tax=Funneliformis geosporum TaxID=1117311 RepID=A0A9W4T396_9GLOM|nr:10711_t:CDS:1 [Funneliformis geosporum]CAI2190930.1 13229_t:CDS:1 [Funneliformis geosporum]
MCQYNEIDEGCSHEKRYTSEENDNDTKTVTFDHGTTYQDVTIAAAENTLPEPTTNLSKDHPGFFQETSTKIAFGVAIIIAFIIGIITIYYINRKRRRKNRHISHKLQLKPKQGSKGSSEMQFVED